LALAFSCSNGPFAGSNDVSAPGNYRFWPFTEISLTANRLKYLVQEKTDGKMPLAIADYRVSGPLGVKTYSKQRSSLKLWILFPI
jgi:hypothetical protein